MSSISNAVAQLKGLVNAVVALFRVACVPPDAIRPQQRQMEINRTAILVSTILLFLARAIEFQLNDLLATFLISGGLAAFAYIFDRSARTLVRWSGHKPKKTSAGARKWATFLIATWIVSLILIMLAGALNILVGVPTLANFFMSPIGAAVAVSLLAILVLALKTKFYNRENIGSVAEIAAYMIVGLIFNSVMLYLFVYLSWQQ